MKFFKIPKLGFWKKTQITTQKCLVYTNEDTNIWRCAYEDLPEDQKGVSYIRQRKWLFKHQIIPCFMRNRKGIHSLWEKIDPVDTSDFADLQTLHQSLVESKLLDKLWIVMAKLDDEMGKWDFVSCMAAFALCVLGTIYFQPGG